jgi:hypothetical protein
MALLSECKLKCVQRPFDAADIVREAIYRQLLARPSRSSAIDAEIIERCCHCSVCVNGNVKRLVYEKIVTVLLSDDAEIVDERLLSPNRQIDLILSHSRCLVLVSSGLSDTADSLRLKMHGCMNRAARADCKSQEDVQVSLQYHEFTCSTSSARYEHRYVGWNPDIGRYSRM